MADTDSWSAKRIVVAAARSSFGGRSRSIKFEVLYSQQRPHVTLPLPSILVTPSTIITVGQPVDRTDNVHTRRIVTKSYRETDS